ncbi:MAG: EAL domain-containing protein [Hormoscilla sp. GM7CHS1pb]|nr:EAL domain-containing protein [Hormoscilla sp. GM7CHS1pb]
MSKVYTVDEVLGQVIAEGVEREAERNLLCQQHCDEMQGYLFSRPLTAKGFQQLLFS